jgi:hypothetical protein
MSQMVKFDDDLYADLEAAAEDEGTTPLGWIAARVPRRQSTGAAGTNGTSAAPPGPSKTMADLFAGHIGGVHGGGLEAVEEKCRGDSFAEYLLQKKREGRL